LILTVDEEALIHISSKRKADKVHTDDDDDAEADVHRGGHDMLLPTSLLLLQFYAIVVKRCYYTRRNWRGLFSQILLPALFVCVAMTVALTAPQVPALA